MISGRSMPLSWPNLRAILSAASLASRPELQKNDVGQARQLAQLGGELLLQRHEVVVRAVDQLADLVAAAPAPASGGAWPSVLTAMPASAVEVLLALGVPEPAASAVRQRDRQAAVGLHHVRLGAGGVGRGHGRSRKACRARSWRRCSGRAGEGGF